MVDNLFENWKTEPDSNPAATQNPPGPQAGQIQTQRIQKRLRVEIQGNHNTVHGETVDFSSSDIRIRITDDHFLTGEILSNPDACRERIQAEFAYGMGVHFPDIKITCTGRLQPFQQGEGAESDPAIFTCGFDRDLNFDTFLKLKSYEAPTGEPEWKKHFKTQKPAVNPGSAEVKASSGGALLGPDAGESVLNDLFDGMAPGSDVEETKEKISSILQKISGDPGEGKGADAQKTSQAGFTLRVEVKGEGRTFKAQAINITTTSALINIADSELRVPDGPGRSIFLNKIIMEYFHRGMVILFPKVDFSSKADPVGVNKINVRSEELTVIECKFRKILTQEEYALLRNPPRAAGETGEQKPASQDTASAAGESKAQGAPASSPAPAPSPAPGPVDIKNIRGLMKFAAERRATDLHIKAGSPPRIRIAGALTALGAEPVTPELCLAMAKDLMTPEQAARFEQEKGVALACTAEASGRFRVNIFRQKDSTALAIRCLPAKIPTLEALGLDPLAKALAGKDHGLVLVIGPAGSGKSTTLAAMVDHLNRTRPCHIITLEKPVEYLHADNKAQVAQREIGRDAVDLEQALEHALRQDPDVLVLEGVRNPEAVALALEAAGSGILVFAALPTGTVAQTLARLIDMFPPERQPGIRNQLADNLQGIMAQRLLPRRDGGGMALVQEYLVVKDSMRVLIRENNLAQIAGAMQKVGGENVQTAEPAVNRLESNRLIT